jgi:hypothetical protein
MRLKRAIVCCLVITSFLCVQCPSSAVAKSDTAAQDATKITQNAPQIKTTPPQVFTSGGTGAGGKKVLWGVLGLAAVIGLVAAIMSGGGGGGGGDDPGRTGDEETGSVRVSW